LESVQSVAIVGALRV